MTPPKRSHPPSISERVYQKLLSACPREFREDHGPQMAQAFGDLYREDRHRGRFGSLRLWSKALPDLALTVVLERNRSGAALNLQPWRERVSGINAIIAFALSLGSGIAVFAVYAAFTYDYPDSWISSWPLPLAGLTAIFLSLNLAVILSIGFMISVKDKITAQSIGLQCVSTWWLLVGATLGLLCWAIGSLAGSLYFWITGEAFYMPLEELFPGISGASFLELAFFWIGVGVLSALANELLFRGILYTYLRRWGVGVALFVSAVVFGLLLSGFSVSLLAFASVGAVLTLVYERSGSLWPAISCAIVINTLGTFFGGLTLF